MNEKEKTLNEVRLEQDKNVPNGMFIGVNIHKTKDMLHAPRSESEIEAMGAELPRMSKMTLLTYLKNEAKNAAYWERRTKGEQMERDRYKEMLHDAEARGKRKDEQIQRLESALDTMNRLVKMLERKEY